MALRVGIRNAANVVAEVNVRSLTLDASMNAEEGSSGSLQLALDDPTGALRVGGHRAVIFYEDSATDPLKQYIMSGYTQQRRYDRGDLVEGSATAGRVITVDVADLNTILGRRVFSAADVTAKRPAETDVQRFLWATATVEAALISDTRYLMTTNPVLMDAKDYRGQFLLGVLEDCAEAGGKNYFVTGFQTGPIATMAGADGATVISVAYFPTSDYTTWPSGVRLTNVKADVDDVTTFVVESASLLSDPTRVKSGSLMPYDGGEVYTELPATATEFARIDTISPAGNVTTAAKATARNLRILNDLATEELRLDITFQMRPAEVNLIRPGMVVNGKFDHLAPEIGTGYVPMRMLDRKNIQTPEDTGFAFYQLSGTFALEVPVCVAPTVVQRNTGGGAALTAYTLLAAPTPGNRLVVAIGSRAPSSLPPDLLAGWTRIHRIDGAPVSFVYHCLEFWTRVVQSGDGTSYALTRNGGVDVYIDGSFDVSEWTPSAVDATAYTSSTTNTATVVLTPASTPDTVVIATALSVDHDVPPVTGMTFDAPLIEQSEQDIGSGIKGKMGLATASLSPGSAQSLTATGTGAFTPDYQAQTLFLAINLIGDC